MCTMEPKMQKYPRLFRPGMNCFFGAVWFSSGGSHMGQQPNTTWRLFQLFTHGKRPSLWKCYWHYTTGGDEKSRDKRYLQIHILPVCTCRYPAVSASCHHARLLHYGTVVHLLQYSCRIIKYPIAFYTNLYYNTHNFQRVQRFASFPSPFTISTGNIGPGGAKI